MAKNVNIQSVEPNIADLVNGWLRSYKLDYKLEQELILVKLVRLLVYLHPQNLPFIKIQTSY